ncbi:DNA-binding transcriptional MerR regulator [Arthrobacter pascens]|uniref:MerR family transcriptional regulator n=1 Tax=Arthrobacter pascens TaxID=1677 RepID=UPI0028554A26|nr:MerR family transcriptional regulator [Arthrobacter pascens]MDR6556043.1 DNA-binding transcriptional MerR regulator [Arthrobacter pascens]
MQLKELSERTGISAASIKFYLREGLLPAGESVHATRARYSTRHVSRLRLIHALRSVVGLSIEQIRPLVKLADGGAPRLEILAAVQRTVLGLTALNTQNGDVRTRAGDAVVRLRNWPDASSDARAALDAHVSLMESLGVPVTTELLDAYSKALDAIADRDINATAAPEDTNELILTAAVGMHLHGQLVLKLLALAQASHAIGRYTKDA